MDPCLLALCMDLYSSSVVLRPLETLWPLWALKDYTPTLITYIYVGLPSEIHQAYLVLLDLLAKLGLDISTQKLVQPTTSAVCLGIRVDIITKISIPSDTLLEIKNICQTCTRRQLQSSLSSLLFITKRVCPA